MMRRNSKHKFYSYFLIVVFTISVGYAVLNKNLVINGNSDILKNTWDIHFENVQVKEGSVSENASFILDDDKLSIDFDVVLSLPGDFYEFSVDAVNSGTIDAMVDSFEITPSLTEEQAKYMKYIVEYQNGEQIKSKQLLEKKSRVRFKVRVEYRSDITEFELPSTSENLNLSFSINYVQNDGSSNSVLNSGVQSVNVIPYADGDLEDIGTIVTIGTEKFYIVGTEGDNVKLLSMYNLYVGNEVTSFDLQKYEGITRPINNPTGMQSEKALGALYNSDIMPDFFPWFGTTSFTNRSKEDLDFYDYNGSILEEYVNNYKELLKLNYSLDVVEARILKMDELKLNNYFCYTNADCSCYTPHPWIISTSYWIYDTSLKNFGFLNTDGDFGDGSYNGNDFRGVRPLIIIPKSIISVNDEEKEKHLIEFSISNVNGEERTYTAEEGMTWGEWVNSKYNTEFRVYNNKINLKNCSGDYCNAYYHNHGLGVLLSKSEFIRFNLSYLMGK